MGPNFVRPRPTLPEHWQNAGTTSLPRSASAPWWHAFDSPALSRLIRRADGGNLDLTLARERIKAARIQRGAAAAESLPTLNGQASYTHERLATAGVGQVLEPLLGLTPDVQTNAPEGVSYTNYSVGAVASWELDIWGRQRRLQEAADAELAAVRADAEATHLSTQAEIARTYFQWLRVSGAVRRADQTLDVARVMLAIDRTVQAHGLLAEADLAERQGFLHSAEGNREALALQLSALRRALAVLVAGRPDAPLPELDGVVSVQDVKVPEIPSGVPSEMARKRPDIRAAEARLHAATAVIGLAQADFYPQITLTGQISLDTLTVAELGWNARNTTFGPTVSLPIFNGGRLSRRLELRHSEQRSAGLLYRSVVLNAWVEIENLLSNRTFLQAQYHRQCALLATADRRVRALRERYGHGDISREEFLAATLSENEMRKNLAEIRVALLTNAVDLTTALGN